MKKKLLSISLALILILSITSTAFAVDSADFSLSAVVYGKVSDWAKNEVGSAITDDLYPSTLSGADLTLPMTRAEFAAVAVKLYEKMSGKTAQPAAATTFTDTTSVDVLKAYNISVVDGTGNNLFSPNSLLNREEAATMLTRVYKAVFWDGWGRRTVNNDDLYTPYLLDSSVTTRFADDSRISTWARESVYFMFKKGIINGMGNNTFAPNNQTAAEIAANYATCTREQALIIADRTFTKVGNSGSATQYRALIGRILNATDKTAVPNASIKLYNSAGTQISSTTLTSAAGIFSFINLTPGNYTIEVSATDYITATIPQFTISATNITHVILGDFSLSKTGTLTGASVTGKVTNAAGANISAVTLTLRDTNLRQAGTAITPATGIYTITGLPAGYYTLEATAAGYSAYTVASFYLSGTAIVTQNITLQALTGGLSISGTIFNISGAAIPGASLILRDSTARQWSVTTSAATGAYSFTGIPAGYYNLEVSASGYATLTTADFLVSSAAVTQNITLTAGSSTTGTTLTGTVTSAATNAVIPGVSVILKNAYGVQVGSMVTPATGVYSFTGLTAGYYSLSFAVTGYTAYNIEALYLTGIGSYNQNVAMQTGTASTVPTVSGTVKNVSGTAISGATVLLINSSGAQAGSAVTSAAGAFTITVSAAGNYSLAVSASGYNTLTTSAFAVSTATPAQNITLTATSTVTGTTLSGVVSNSVSGAAIYGATVILRNSAGVQVNAATTTTNGLYSFSGVAAGYYTVEASASGYNAYTTNPQINITGTGSYTLNITLVATSTQVGTTISGTVTNATTGGIIAGASVVLKNSAGTQVGSTTTSTSGAYSFTGITTAGYYTLTVSAGTYTTLTTSAFNVPGTGTTIQQNATLQSASVVVNGNVINGRVLGNGNTTPVSGANITLKDSNGSVQRTSVSGAEGYFTFTGLFAGSYIVEVTASGYNSASAIVQVSGNESFIRDFSLTK